jgi:dTDP-4-dehydrorhamnose reductase/dTDP-4-dehydrorhamnose 3,5-epimerase
MEKIATKLKDCYILEPKRFGDERGYFESITQEQLKELGFHGISQVSNSKSGKGIVRGLHFQQDPYCQAKAVRCHRGGVLDVVVDLRKDSPSYKDYICVELTPENGRILFVPRGFAHGFVSLTDDTLFEYCVDNEYTPRLEGGILWNDSEIGIDWDEIFKKYNINSPILSNKDINRETLEKCNPDFNRKNTRYLITGFNGQLGYDIARELKKRGETDYLVTDIKDMDITNRDQVFDVITKYQPDVIFHCAAWTAVDKAEKEPDKVFNINVLGTKNVVDASIEVGAKIFYMSTDYVFDGKKDGYYTEEDPVNPMSVYGKTKYLGEEEVRRNPNHFITRISWVFGINGNNFIKTILSLAPTHPEFTVVDDQVGSPTYTVDLSKLLVEMAHSDKYGTYHVNNDGYCSWAEFADYIFKSNGLENKVIPISTEEYILKAGPQAYRPRNSKLSKDKLVAALFPMLPTWENATDRYCEELKNEKRLTKILK